LTDTGLFIALTIPVMVLLGVRHGLDVDHITAIDNLVRLHNAVKRARWVGSSFSAGHMLAVCLEMIALIYIVKSLEAAATVQFWGGILGAMALGTIGSANLYSMHRYGKTGPAILTGKISRATGFAGPIGSAFLTGLVFGLGFDTASQISALTVSAVATATQGLQVASILAGFFALGMIPTDTLDSLVLRSVFAKIMGTVGFRIISYGLSIVALSIAAAESYSVISGVDFLPVWTGALLAFVILAAGFTYAYQKHKSELPVQASLEPKKPFPDPQS
jgi:high-affinity nickel-transport protein